MRRPVLLAVLTCGGLGLAVPAHAADSTTTQTAPAGGSVRSIPGPPTPETPLVVIVTNRTQPQPTPPGCPPETCGPGDPGTRSVTISLKDARDRANGPGLEGPSGYVFRGPQVDVGSTAAPQDVAVSFELDASVPMPGSLTPNPFQVAVYRSGTNSPFVPTGLVSTPLPDGDLRLTTDPSRGGSFTGPGSFDVLENAFFASAVSRTESLPAARSKGVKFFLKTNFKITADWTITVSNSVRRALRLKSAVIGRKSFASPAGGDRTVPLTAAARKALKKYKRVKATARVVARAPNGDVITDKVTVTLKTPESDLG